MIRKATILLSLCCAILCAFIGYLSYSSMKESERVDGEAAPMTCEAVLNSPILQNARIKLTEFAPGKHLAHLDNDGDDQWDSLCVPFFPPKHQKIGYGYCAVLVCFKNIPTRERLETVMETGELDINFWLGRQHLDRAIHSQLAQQYTNMDIANSPVLYYGFDGQNPLLGESTLYLSAGAGSVALCVALLALISGIFLRTKPTRVDVDLEDQPTTNRAGLPVNEHRSVLDQVTPARSVPGE